MALCSKNNNIVLREVTGGRDCYLWLCNLYYGLILHLCYFAAGWVSVDSWWLICLKDKHFMIANVRIHDTCLGVEIFEVI